MKVIRWETQAFVINLFVFVGLCLASQFVFAQNTELTEFSATYRGYRNGLKIGTAKQSLTQRADGLYQLNYESHASLFILRDHREEKSVFAFTDGELVPVSYDYARTGTGKDKSLHIDFDEDTHQLIINQATPQKWTNELDNQLYRYDFQLKLNANTPKLTYNIVNSRGEEKTYRLAIIGEETLELPYGKLSTVRAKIVRENTKRETFIWFAPELDHLMVRIQQFKNGSEQLDVQLASLEIAK